MENKRKVSRDTDYKKKISFNVDGELHKALKIAATSSNMSIKMYILRLVAAELSRTGFVNIK